MFKRGLLQETLGKFLDNADMIFHCAGEPALHLPFIVPYILRRLWHGYSNKGDVRY